MKLKSSFIFLTSLIAIVACSSIPKKDGGNMAEAMEKAHTRQTAAWGGGGDSLTLELYETFPSSEKVRFIVPNDEVARDFLLAALRGYKIMKGNTDRFPPRVTDYLGKAIVSSITRETYTPINSVPHLVRNNIEYVVYYEDNVGFSVVTSSYARLSETQKIMHSVHSFLQKALVKEDSNYEYSSLIQLEQ